MDNFYRSWESLVTLRLPSDCWVVFWSNESEKKYPCFLYKPTKKRKRFHIWKCHVTMTKKEAYKGNSFQFLNYLLSFIVRNYSLLSATSVPSRPPMPYKTSASLDKLTCIDYVDFGNSQSNYLKVKLKLFNRDDNRDFRLVQNMTKREADINRVLRLRSQLVIAAKNFGIEENLSPVLIHKMYQDMDEQLKLAQKVVDVVDRAHKKVCVTLLRYNVDKQQNWYAKARLFWRNKEHERFQQILRVNCKL